MSYLSKYYTMAENELNMRIQNNKQTQQENIYYAEQKVPQIKELRKQLAAGGARLSTVLLNGGSAKQTVKELSAENLEIKNKIRQLLVNNNLDENFLEPIYSCEKCRDTGIYEGKRCSCFMNDVQRFQCDDLNRASGMSLCTFDSFSLSFYPNECVNGNKDTVRKTMEKVFEYCKHYAESFPTQTGILMLGATGLGKTHLSLAIANRVIKSGYSAIYGSAPDLFRKVEREHFGGGEQTDTLQLLIDCDLLIFDDLGTEFDSKFNQTTLYNLINTRMNKLRPIIVNTNLMLSEIQQRYGERISSRLLTMERLPFVGQDVRVQKKMEQK